jgi:hypothetical protein
VGVWPRLRSVIKSDKRDKTPSFFGGLLCHHLPMGDDGVVSYLQVGESKQTAYLITREREKDGYFIKG